MEFTNEKSTARDKTSDSNLFSLIFDFHAISPYFTPLIPHHSEKEITDFHKFMLCKIMTKDYQLGESGDGVLLSPGKAIDEVWREMLLRPSLYMKYMKYLFHDEKEMSYIDHKPEGFNEIDEIEIKRLRKTAEVWKELFGPEDKFPGEDDISDIEKHGAYHKRFPQDETYVKPSEPNQIDIIINDKIGNHYKISLPDNSTVAILKKRIRAKEELSIHRMILFCEGMPLDDKILVRDLPSFNVHLFIKLSDVG